jgi:hypothetical protein
MFGGSKCVGSRFHVLRSRTRFGWYQGRRVSFSCFTLPDSFSAVPRMTGTVFLFCAPELIFDSTEGVESHFHVLHARTHFRRNRGCRLPFSCFVLPNSFSTIRGASIHVFMFCAPGQIFGRTEGVRTRFHILRSRTRFRRCQSRRVPFSCFAHQHSLSAEQRASGHVFMFCAPELVSGCTEGVGSRFHFLAPPNSFSSGPVFKVGAPGLVSTLPRASGPVFMFRVLGLIFGGSEGAVSYFHLLRSRTRFRRYRERRSHFHVLPARTRFRRYQGCRVPFLCFALADSFSAVPWAPGPVFMFSAPGLVFGVTEGVLSRFLVLRSRARFRRYRGCLVLFSCFALPYSFSAVPRASGPVFMFCAPVLVFGGT